MGWQRQGVLKAKLKNAGPHFHDQHGTAVTCLALSGCTVPQIASITDHSQRAPEAILDTHVFGGRFELAEQAIAKPEAN